MDMNLDVSPDGAIQTMTVGERVIPFRCDEYKGFSFHIENNGNVQAVSLKKAEEQNYYTGKLCGLLFGLRYSKIEKGLKVELSVKNLESVYQQFDRVFVRLGIDSYMDCYPEWNEHYFPTLLRCEKTHFYGYYMTPMGEILAIASPDPIASWGHEYNRVDYDGENHVGHRIYTSAIDLLSGLPQPDRHPDNVKGLQPEQTQHVTLYIACLDELSELHSFISTATSAPIILLDKYTIERNEEVNIHVDGELQIISPSGKVNSGKFNEYGVYTLNARKNNKESRVLLYVRKSWSWYLKQAGVSALQNEQKASTHFESWNGYFSSFLTLKHMPEEMEKERLVKDFDRKLNLMFDVKTGKPRPNACPERVQNSAAMTALLADAFEATGRYEYLDYGKKITEFVLSCQDKDGAYLCDETHYTCVTYVAKYIYEFYLCIKEIPEYQSFAKTVLDSVKRAVHNLYELKDNIMTEGEMTFEDGMISCECLQLAMMAFYEAEPYGETALEIMDKHRCLEQAFVPDCRMRGCTIRFWEGMYDVLINANFINSPHGWTSWKTYATYYLYRLTGDYQYLIDTMDTLGACMQCVDMDTGKLRWAFISDPCISVNVFEQEGEAGVLRERVIGEQYIDMLSGWWKAGDHLVKGYAYPDLGRVDGEYLGACCDNDVHEHFKCLEEVALTKAYIHQLEDRFATFNCRLIGKQIYLSEDCIDEIIIHCEDKTQFEWIDHNGKSMMILCNPGFNTPLS